MKRILFTLLFSFICLSIIAQVNTTSDWITVKKEFQLKGKVITDIQKDSALRDSFKLPTSKAVKEFVEGRLLNLSTGTADSCISCLYDVIKTSGPYADTLKFYKGDTLYLTFAIPYKNGLYSGCDVTAINDTTYRISAASYRITGISYTSNTDTIQVSSNNNANALYRVFGVDNTGNTFVKNGLPAPNPPIPTPLTSQLGCATVFFPGSGGTPVINNYTTNVYNVGIDSGAYHIGNGVQLNDTTILLCNLYGQCDTIKVKMVFNVTINADNGIVNESSTLRLGGNLIQNTTIDADGNDFKILNANDLNLRSGFDGGFIQNQINSTGGSLELFRFSYGNQSFVTLTDSVVNLYAESLGDGHSIKVRPNGVEINAPAFDSAKVFIDKLPYDPTNGTTSQVVRYNPATKQVFRGPDNVGGGGGNYISSDGETILLSDIDVYGSGSSVHFGRLGQLNEFSVYTDNFNITGESVSIASVGNAIYLSALKTYISNQIQAPGLAVDSTEDITGLKIVAIDPLGYQKSVPFKKEPKIYKAMLEQIGIDAPTVIYEYKNNFGSTPSFMYDDVGHFIIDFGADAFDQSKVFVNGSVAKILVPSDVRNFFGKADDNRSISVYVTDAGGPRDGNIINISIEYYE